MLLVEVNHEETTTWEAATGDAFHASLFCDVKIELRVGKTQEALYIQRAINKGKRPAVDNMLSTFRATTTQSVGGGWPNVFEAPSPDWNPTQTTGITYAISGMLAPQMVQAPQFQRIRVGLHPNGTDKVKDVPSPSVKCLIAARTVKFLEAQLETTWQDHFESKCAEETYKPLSDVPRQGYAVFASNVKVPVGVDHSPTFEIGACRPKRSWHIRALDIPFQQNLQQAPGPHLVKGPKSWYDEFPMAGKGRTQACYSMQRLGKLP